jgi:hypothetical protein
MESIASCASSGLKSRVQFRTRIKLGHAASRCIAFLKSAKLRYWGSLIVPVEELMRDLPLVVALEQGEYVGSSGIGASQLA